MGCFFLSLNVVMRAGYSSDCPLLLEILSEGKGQVSDGTGMRAQEPLLLIRTFGPLFPLSGHPGKSILPPPVFAKPNTSINMPSAWGLSCTARELASFFVA